MNEYDSEQLAGVLSSQGMEATKDIDQADLVVLNTCCIRENADNRLYGNLGFLKSRKKANPNLQIAVAGCLAQKDKDLVLEKAPHVDVVLGTHNLSRINVLLEESKRTSSSVIEIWDSAPPDILLSPLPTQRESSISAWLTIQTGCNNSCSFCIVPSVRGTEVSKYFGQVINEASLLAQKGVVEITLLGQNVNSYGRDLTLQSIKDTTSKDSELIFKLGQEWTQAQKRKRRPLFADLLKAVGAVQGIDRVRFTSPHPKDLRPETIQAMATTPQVCEHLHLPVQSGSDRILAAMHRGYSSERYLEKLELARKNIPDLAVTTDIIVGFPGETEQDFEQTLQLAAEVSYDNVFTYIFSPRPGTVAEKLSKDFVPSEVVAERFERLKVVSERSALAKHRERIGKIEEVLIEGPSKKNPDVIAGRTRQNKLVHFQAPPQYLSSLNLGAKAKVLITSAASHHLSGDFISTTGTKPRRLLPVISI